MSGRARDAIVVGAGPAGSAVACFLAQHGHDVLVVEAARFPRDKVCGESVSPEAWPLLDAMDAGEPVRRQHPQRIRGMRLVAPDGTSARGEYRTGASGFALRRLELDQTLLDAARRAGAVVYEDARVTALVQEAGAVVGVAARVEGEERLFRARIVVGADGRRSVVARRLGLLREHPRLRRFAVRGYWEDVQGLEELGEMHVGRRGYCGVAPLSATRANVTFVLDAREMAAAAGDLEGFYLGSLRQRWPDLAERLSAATLCGPPRATGPLALECLGVAVPGAVLVGDAAGFYDPFTGEGITLALRTARLAVDALDPALRTAGGAALPLAALAAYGRARETATRDKFRFNRLVQSAVTRPFVANALVRRLARRPDLADRLVGIAGDFVPARTALGLRFLLDLVLA